jgi:hypothetical protein
MSNPVERKTDESTGTSEILSQCLQSIEAGEATVEGCLARYPDIPELGSLLRSMALVQELPRPLLPPANKAQMREQVLARFRERQAIEPARHASPHRMSRWLQLAAAVAMAAIILFSGGVGLVRAADSAVPGDGLYGLKRLAEQVELSVADEQTRPDVLYRIALVRVTEVDVLSERGTSLTDAELTDLSQSINAALAAHPDTAKRTSLLLTADQALKKAESAGTLGAGKRTEVLQTLRVTPESASSTPASPAAGAGAGPEARPSETPTLTLSPPPTDTPTEAPTETATMTATPTETATLTLTVTPSLTATYTPELTATLTSTPTGDSNSTDDATKATHKPKATQRPPRTSPTPGSGNNNPGGGNKGSKK